MEQVWKCTGCGSTVKGEGMPPDDYSMPQCARCDCVVFTRAVPAPVPMTDQWRKWLKDNGEALHELAWAKVQVMIDTGQNPPWSNAYSWCWYCNTTPGHDPVNCGLYVPECPKFGIKAGQVHMVPVPWR